MGTIGWVTLAVMGLVIVGVVALLVQGWRYWNERWDATCRAFGFDPAIERRRLGMSPPRTKNRH